MKDKTKTRKNRSGQKNAAGRIKILTKDYRAILDAAGDGIFLYDIDRDETIAVNEKAREILGNPEGNITFTALPFIRGGESPWTQEAALHHLRKAAAGEPRLFEWMTKDHNGRPSWREVSLKRSLIGDKASVLVSVRDITQQKNAQAALKESEEPYRTIFENTGAATVILEEDATISLANSEYERLSGYTLEEIEGKKKWTEFVVREDLDRMLESSRIRRVDRNAAPKRYEFRFIDSQGRIKDIFLSIDLIPGTKKSVASLLDITDRKHAEKALQESEKKYRELVENANSIILRMDRSGNVTFFNEFAQRFFGYSEEEILGKNVVGTIVPERESTGRDLKGLIEDIARNPERYANNLNENMRRDGTKVWIAWTNKPVRDENGRVTEMLCIGNDTTERKKAEEALKKSGEQLRRITDNMVDLVIQIDTEAVFQYLAPSVTRLFGYYIEEMMGKCAFDFIHPDDRPAAIEAFQQVIKRGRGTVELQLRHKEGHYLWMELLGNTVAGEDGRIDGIIVGCRDITKRKKTEEALRESQRRLADIIEFLPDATIVIDREGRVIAWNRALEQMTGVKAQDMLGKGNYEYSLPFYGERRPILVDLALNPDSETEKKYVATERHDRVLSGEAYMPALRGGEVYLHGTASILRDSKGHVAGAIETIHDITERRQAEEALARAEEKYRGIFENAVEGIFQVSPEGRLISANPAFARIFGYDSPEEMQQTITKAYRQLGIDPKHRANFLHLVEEQGLAQDYEVQARRKNDGRPVWLSVTMRAVRNDRDKTMYYEGTVQDISERKLLESRLLQAQKMEAIGTLAGGIAHDFNNILAAIMGYTEITKNKLKQAELHRHLEQVLNACERARNLVSQILTFSRQQDKEMKPVDMVPLVKEALQLLRAAIPTTVEIRLRISPKVRAVLADPTQIHQVMVNLCTNAAHSMRHKGGVLGIGLDHREVTAWNKDLYPDLRPGPYVELTISDTGTGIEQAIIHRIFDPFFTTKDTGEGTGLGLSVVYGIVKEHGGTITVQSEPGAGSMFRVCLPATEPEGKLKADSSEAIPGDGERILFVDDEEIISEIGKEILEELSYRVISTTSSTKALEIFRAHPHRFELIITDMTMPGMTGLDLAREILGIQPDIPMILCTGFNEFIHEEDVRELGIKALLLKPFSVKDFAAVIRRVLDESKDPGKTS